MNRFIFTSIVTSLFLSCTHARAELVIDFGKSTFGPNGIGGIDVFVSGEDPFLLYNMTFRISQVNAQGILEFRSSFDSGDASNELNQSDSEIGRSDYVFGTSNRFQSVVQETNRGQVAQSDFTFPEVTLTEQGLLAHLELRHFVPEAEVPNFPGAEYRVELVRGPSQTFFRNQAGIVIEPAEASFANFGTIEITAVPEPSFAFLLCIATITLLVRRRYFKRRLLISGVLSSNTAC